MEDYYFISDDAQSEEPTTEQSSKQSAKRPSTKPSNKRPTTRSTKRPKSTKSPQELKKKFEKGKKGKIIPNKKKTKSKSRSKSRSKSAKKQIISRTKPKRSSLFSYSLPAEKLNQKKKQLLDIYYHEKDECDHLWLDHPMIYIDGERFPEGEQILDRIYRTIEEFNMNEKKALIVHINSPGGHGDAGYMLYHLIKNIRKPTIGVIEYICASAAVFPLIACDLRISKPFNMFLIHQLRGVMSGKFKEVRRNIYQWQTEYEKDIKVFSKETKMKRPRIKELLRSERFLNLNELLRDGIIDHVFDPQRVQKLNVQKLVPLSAPKELGMRDFLKYLKILSSPNVLLENKVSQITLITDYNALTYNGIFYSLNLMLDIPIPINLIAPTTLTNGYFLMSLFTQKAVLLGQNQYITLYKEPLLEQGFVYSSQSLEDQTKNTNHMRDMVLHLIKTRTNLPEKILKEVPFKRLDFNSSEATKYKLVSGIIRHK